MRRKRYLTGCFENCPRKQIRFCKGKTFRRLLKFGFTLFGQVKRLARAKRNCKIIHQTSFLLSLSSHPKLQIAFLFLKKNSFCRIQHAGDTFFVIIFSSSTKNNYMTNVRPTDRRNFKKSGFRDLVEH